MFRKEPHVFSCENLNGKLKEQKRDYWRGGRGLLRRDEETSMDNEKKLLKAKYHLIILKCHK